MEHLMKAVIIAAAVMVVAAVNTSAGETLEGLCVISGEGTTITLKCGHADVAAHIEAKRKEMEEHKK